MDNPVLTEWLTRPGGLATRLRVARLQADLTGRSMAARLGWGPNKVSRLENGRQLPTRGEIDAWTVACRRPDLADELIELLGRAEVARFSWRERLAGYHIDLHAAYTRLFEQTAEVSMVEVAVLPGPLQTQAYARAVLTSVAVVHATSATDIDNAVAERAKQARLLAEGGTSFEFIIAESVLRRAPCRPDEMIDQLDHLLTVTDDPGVTLRVLPDRAGVAAVPVNSFHVFDHDLVLVESFADEHEHHADDDTARYHRALEQLRVHALTGAEARDLIDDAMMFHHQAFDVPRAG